jgi:hypothetical protein
VVRIGESREREELANPHPRIRVVVLGRMVARVMSIDVGAWYALFDVCLHLLRIPHWH